MRKSRLLLCGITIVTMIVSPCQAVSSNVECRWIPGWYCPSGAESYTDKNSAMAPIWHTDLKGCNFANQWGEILTTDYFDRIGDFSEGMAWVVTNGTVGYIDTMGTLVIRLPENILSCGDFHNGRALIEETDGDKYYIDKTGEIVYHSPENIFLAAEFDEHGIAPAKDLQSGLYGYYNQAGYWEIPPKYEKTYSFEGDYATFQENGKYGVMNRSGTIIFPAEYEYIYIVLEGGASTPSLFCVRATPHEEWLFGLADSNGTILVEPQNRWMFSVPNYSCGYWVIDYRYDRDPDNCWEPGMPLTGLIDEKGNEISLPYEWADSQFREGLLMVGDSETTKYIDTNLDIVLSLPVSKKDYVASPFIGGLASVATHDGSHTYVIDQSGDTLCEMANCFVHDAYGVFPEGVCWAESSSETDQGSFVYFDPRLRDYTSPWAEGEMKQAKAAGLVTESNDSYFTFRITRRRFAELAANLVEQATGQTITPAAEGTFTDTDDLWVRKAAAIGLVNGLGDGSRFSPNGYISREQLATMLYRAIRYIESQTGTTILAEQGSLEGYTDAAQVSPWAQEAMAALHAAGILKGTSGTTLSPKDTTTVEQGILLTLRAYEMAAGE